MNRIRAKRSAESITARRLVISTSPRGWIALNELDIPDRFASVIVIAAGIMAGVSE
jgi:hypothetical protein